MLSCSHALLLSCPNATALYHKCIKHTVRTNQPGKEDRKDSHHKLSALLSLIFGRSSSWCSMTNKATASSIQLECHRIKKSHINHAFMLSCSLELLPQCQCSVSQRYQAYCCIQISREKKTEKILITSGQLCWAWYLEDHPLDAAWPNNLACSLASSRSSLFHSRGHSSRNENLCSAGYPAWGPLSTRHPPKVKKQK